MSDFKVGETVKLTGEAWGYGGSDFLGRLVEISRITPSGYPQFEHNGDYWSICSSGGHADYSATALPGASMVEHPKHYNVHPSGVETIDIIRQESFLRGNIIKYVLRSPYRGKELEDMRKAAQYLQWEIERLEEEAK